MHMTGYVIVYCRNLQENCDMDHLNDYRVHTTGDDGDQQIGKKILRDLGSMSEGKQLLFGIATGFVTGYALTKFGKCLCIAIGSGVIILQIANQNDYIKFNLLQSLSREAEHGGGTDASRRIHNVSSRPSTSSFGWIRALRHFLLEQPNLTSGYIGGFLIGLGLS